jgi:hypothetical protein
MKLNTGIIAHAMPAAPSYVCGVPAHKLCLSDVRFFITASPAFSDEILYFTHWDTLGQYSGALPAYLLCIGGGAAAATLFKSRNITGIITDDGDMLVAFGIVQSIFLRFNQLETSLLTALRGMAPLSDILNCCAEFFENQAVLYDSDRNMIGSSDVYLPDADDPYWMETLETGRRSERLLADAKKAGVYPNAIRTPSSDYVDLGPGLPKIITYSYFENGKRLATLNITQTNKQLSVFQLKLLDHVAELISSSLVHLFNGTTGRLEILRGVFCAMLNKESVDPLLVKRCLGLAGWRGEDDFLLALIEFGGTLSKLEPLTRSRHIYERLFQDCVCFVYNNTLVLLIHNDTTELAAGLPKLERQLAIHNAACGFSLPFKGIAQLGAQYANAEISLRRGSKDSRIRFLNERIGDYLIERIAVHTPLFPLCHRETVRLLEYDNDNGTDLLLTLETYLRHNKSLKAAAEELFIHRSTMTYRLGCIEKIARMNLDDPSERLHILLSCIVLRSLGRQQQSEAQPGRPS